MSIMKSKQPKDYRWQKGDFISPLEAAQLLGYKSAAIFEKKDRRENLKKQFESVGCKLTEITVNGVEGKRILRSEIDEYLTRLVANAQEFEAKISGQLAK